MTDQRENAERKHTGNTQKTQKKNTDRKHREKTQTENTERKHRQKHGLKTHRKHADRKHRRKTQSENTITILCCGGKSLQLPSWLLFVDGTDAFSGVVVLLALLIFLSRTEQDLRECVVISESACAEPSTFLIERMSS